MKAKIIGLSLAIVALIGLYWVSTVSYVTVTVSGNNASQSTDYQFYKQGNKKPTSTSSTGTEARQRVSRGTQEILVSQGGKNYFAVVKTGGFFSNKSVAAQLKPEKNRSFVGNDPANCMQLVAGVLVSYTCTDSYSNIKIHKPASAQEPTQVVANPNIAAGSVEGFVQTNQGNLVLLQWPSFGETEPRQAIYQVSASLELKNEVTLADLSGEETYNIKPFKDGFLVYNANLTKALYYSNQRAKPTQMKIDKVSNTKLGPMYSAVEKDSIITVYSSDEDSKKAQSEIIVSTGQTSQHYKFKKRYTQATICGTEKLCAVGSQGLDVYDIDGDSATLLYTVSGAKSILTSQKSLLVVRDQEVLNLDVNNQNGFVDYRAGGYIVNSMITAPGGYLINATDPKGKKVALFVDEQSTSSDLIDQKVAELENVEGVQEVSAYKQFIYITPDVGELAYNDALQSFTYDQAKVSSVSKTINESIKKIGINTSIYKIVNTAQ